MIAHPFAELLAGPVGEGIPQVGLGRFSGDGLQPQASTGIEQHREQRLAAAAARSVEDPPVLTTAETGSMA